MYLGTTIRDDKLSQEEWENGWPWTPTQEGIFQGKSVKFPNDIMRGKGGKRR